MFLLFLLALIAIGAVLHLLRARIDPTIYTIVITLIVLAIALWILHAFGLISLPAAFRLGVRG